MGMNDDRGSLQSKFAANLRGSADLSAHIGEEGQNGTGFANVSLRSSANLIVTGCKSLYQTCWVWPGQHCCPGFSCQPGIPQRCYHKPRQFCEPCSAGFGCAPGLKCGFVGGKVMRCYDPHTTEYCGNMMGDDHKVLQLDVMPTAVGLTNLNAQAPGDEAGNSTLSRK